MSLWQRTTTASLHRLARPACVSWPKICLPPHAPDRPVFVCHGHDKRCLVRATGRVHEAGDARDSSAPEPDLTPVYGAGGLRLPPCPSQWDGPHLAAGDSASATHLPPLRSLSPARVWARCGGGANGVAPADTHSVNRPQEGICPVVLMESPTLMARSLVPTEGRRLLFFRTRG